MTGPHFDQGQRNYQLGLEWARQFEASVYGYQWMLLFAFNCLDLTTPTPEFNMDELESIVCGEWWYP